MIVEDSRPPIEALVSTGLLVDEVSSISDKIAAFQRIEWESLLLSVSFGFIDSL